ncbi:MAG: glycosyltransferase family 2 protein [Candidatus Moranbacteria bacterium]|nr:glycosyltransferase family 2 protein [Candidatus Moranbacteria bacterium]
MLANKIQRFIPELLRPLVAKIYHLEITEMILDLILKLQITNSDRKLIHLVKNNREVPKKFKIGMAVLAYERPEYLEACLDSLFRTKLYDYDITFLLQDDGSKDPEVNKIINQERDPKYKIVRSYTKKGHNSWAGAFNKAMRKLLEIDDFDIVGSCDSDCLFHPEWLDKTIRMALWAKKNHQEHILIKFSSFNSDQWEFHKILGTYRSPYGKFLVKERMGDLNSFYFTKDLLGVGFYEESKDDETIMTEKFKKLGFRNFCTERSYVEHLGKVSVLDKWRPVPGGENYTFAAKPVLEGWDLPEYIYRKFDNIRHYTFVIQVFYPGLGDHLFYSHLPRIAKNLGLKKVLVSEHSELRSPEAKKLIWESNPYIDGFTREKSYRAPDFTKLSPKMNLLDKIMLDQGLDDGQRFHEPEVHYKPKKIKELEGKNIYDPNYIANAGAMNSKALERYLKKFRINMDYQMALRKGSNHIPLLRKVKELETTSKGSTLEKFCDVIGSCKRIYCLTTGTATLAAALGKPATVFYGKGVGLQFHHSKLHRYVKLDKL